MDIRTIRLGDYDTAAQGLWTLSALAFPVPDLVENLVNVPGRVKGPLDLSTALTDGEPTYGPRALSITLESSEGNRLERKARISELVNKFHGRRVESIVLPDYPMHYAVGRLAVNVLYNDLAHCAVEITGTCEPWLYAKDETVAPLVATATQQAVTLRNAGTMPVVPTLEISAEEGGSVLLAYGAANIALSAGTYVWPDLLLTPGDHELQYSGAGSVIIKYREAVLE